MRLYCDIHLPASKSESNRALMIAAYGGFVPNIQHLSDSNDTLVLANALREIQQNKTIIDIADCGAAARFLITFLACRNGEWVLTGTARMKQRPIAPLVKALRELGADIQYVEREGCLPLQINGKPISGGKVKIDMTQSSQFASSLLLAAPMLPQDVELELLGNLNSMPYVDMTLAMMRHFGAEIESHGRNIGVKAKPYRPASFMVSSDWTAASYWYEMGAFSEECEIRLHGLSLPSLQGDAVIVEWMQRLGVGTFVEGGVVVLRKIPCEKHTLSFDFSQHPDLYPTLAATCAGLHVEARFTGLDNLVFKESDRERAMQMELAKLGSLPLRFCSHGDHRIVMALAPLALLYGSVAFDCPEVVRKSYPNYWEDVSFLPVYGENNGF